MNIELRPLDEPNKEECLRLTVSKTQADYIAPNESSLAAAEEHADVARPFVICADGEAVGFVMFAVEPEYEDPNDRYWLWRFMIDERYQGRGYGKAALMKIIEYFKSIGAPNIRLSTKESNSGAIRLYKSAGFKPTGEIIDGETVFELDFE
ncbi:MAG: GNAT family N-acetyltransferase [Lachnospiraceae bacterium]|nr:GNAT family N-acetyltransferase [Lachnospiraceae bacterium]MBR5677982.1 GNAT family N-acetyltransferase [Paludibacteraceae bacterium]